MPFPGLSSIQKKGFRHLTFSSPSFVISQLILSVGGTEKKKKRILHMSC